MGCMMCLLSYDYWRRDPLVRFYRSVMLLAACLPLQVCESMCTIVLVHSPWAPSSYFCSLPPWSSACACCLLCGWLWRYTSPNWDFLVCNGQLCTFYYMIRMVFCKWYCFFYDLPCCLWSAQIFVVVLWVGRIVCQCIFSSSSNVFSDSSEIQQGHHSPVLFPDLILV